MHLAIGLLQQQRSWIYSKQSIQEYSFLSRNCYQFRVIPPSGSRRRFDEEDERLRMECQGHKTPRGKNGTLGMIELVLTIIKTVRHTYDHEQSIIEEGKIREQQEDKWVEEYYRSRRDPY